MKKNFLTISEVALRLGCTEANVYNSIKTGSLQTIAKATYIQTEEGRFVATGERKQYITLQSVKDKQSGKNARPKKGKQIRATYVDNKSTFENGETSIVFPSETVAAQKLKIGKFKLRYTMEKGTLIEDRISVQKVS